MLIPYHAPKKAPVMHVYFTGSTAVKRGQGLCFDTDYSSGTITGHAATDATDQRLRRVELPASGNNLRFAGYAVQDYPARTGGQIVEMAHGEGWAFVLAGVDTVLDTTYLTVSVAPGVQGYSDYQGFMGKGTALALQTDAGVVKFTSLDGSTAAATSGGVTTITKTGIGTASSVGDRLVVYGGATTAGAAAGTAGVYPILTITDANNVTIGTDLGAARIACKVLDDADHVVLAYIFDGPESGLTDWTSPRNDAASSPVPMVGGVTFVIGGVTLGTGVSTFTLADGTVNGLRKAFVGMGTLTTNGFVVTVTSGEQKDGASALDTATIDAANEFIALEWAGSFATNTSGVWQEKQSANYTAA